MTSVSTSRQDRSETDRMVSLILPMRGAEATAACVRRLTAAAESMPHEILIVGAEGDPALACFSSGPDYPPTVRLLKSDRHDPVSTGEAMRVAFPELAGGIVVPIDPAIEAPLECVVALVAAIREEGCAVAIATAPRSRWPGALWEWVLAAVGGLGAWNAAAGLRAYPADFLARQKIESDDPSLEMAIKAQLQGRAITEVAAPPCRRIAAPAMRATPWILRAWRAPLIVWGLWLVMTASALAATAVSRHGLPWGYVANIALPAAAAYALSLAVRRVRGRMRIADAFFPLVLLSPFLWQRATGPYDPSLMAAGLLGLMAGAVIAMKRDSLLRYLAVAALGLGLALVSETFLILLPPLVVWLLGAGYVLAKSDVPALRRRGVFVMAAGEAAMFIFALAAMLGERTPAPESGTLFTTIAGFTEFPLLILAIVMLALGWRRGPGGRTPRYLAGVLALLIGLLAMLLNNFQAGKLPPPGADQTVLIVCLVYTVMALHGPRRLRWIAPPILLAAAIGYTLWR